MYGGFIRPIQKILFPVAVTRASRKSISLKNDPRVSVARFVIPNLCYVEVAAIWLLRKKWRE